MNHSCFFLDTYDDHDKQIKLVPGKTKKHMFLRDSKVWPEIVRFNHRNMLISVTITGFAVWKDYTRLPDT